MVRHTVHGPKNLYRAPCTVQPHTMEHYFYQKNGEQQGPFTLSELKEQDILPHTKVWHFGMEHWIEARELPALRGFFQTVVPETLSGDSELLDSHQATHWEGEHYPSRGLVGTSIAAIFFLGVFGIAAAVYTYQAQQHFRNGDYDRARECDQIAWRIIKVGGLIMGVFLVIFLVMSIIYATVHEPIR